MPVPENLPAHAKTIFEHTMGALKGKINKRTGKAYTDEERGKIAWNAVKQKYKKVGEKWEAKQEDEDNEEEVFSEILEFKAEDGKYFFKGYLSTFDVDLVNDLVTPECMSDMLNQIKTGLTGFARSIKGSPDHDVYHTQDTMRVPISKITDATVDNRGLLVEGMFNADHPEFKTIWSQIQNGFLDGLSIEYKPVDFSFKDIDGKKVRILNKIALKGYGHTPRPANPYSTLTDCFVKSLELADAADIIKTLTSVSASMDVGTSYSPTAGSIPVLVPTIVDDARKIKEHLKKDKETWMELAKKAQEEADSDMKLLEQLKDFTDNSQGSAEEKKDKFPETKEESLVTEVKKEEVKAEPQPVVPQTEVKELPKTEKVEVKAEEKKEEIKSLEEQIKTIVKEELKSLLPEKKALSDTSEKFEEVKSEPKSVVDLVVKGLGGR